MLDEPAVAAQFEAGRVGQQRPGQGDAEALTIGQGGDLAVNGVTSQQEAGQGGPDLLRWAVRGGGADDVQDARLLVEPVAALGEVADAAGVSHHGTLTPEPPAGGVDGSAHGHRQTLDDVHRTALLCSTGRPVPAPSATRRSRLPVAALSPGGGVPGRRTLPRMPSSTPPGACTTSGDVLAVLDLAECAGARLWIDGG